jgi:ribosomal protein L11 methyltransferase
VASTDRWYALDVFIEPQAREAVEYGLMEAGALGTEFSETGEEAARVTAYFADAPQREVVRHELFEALRIYSLPSSVVRNIEFREIENKDWLREWKESWQPVEVAERFLIAPPWSEIPANNDRIVIRIEPGMAFGTGTHETTRLCLTAIEKYFAGGSFLDVGTGTGILAIAAAKLFPRAMVAAYDNDPEAIEIARENAVLNETRNIEFHSESIDETTASASLVCANLTAPVILQLLPPLVGASCGRLVISGVLDSQVELIEDALRALGINDLVEIAHEGEWVAMIV